MESSDEAMAFSGVSESDTDTSMFDWPLQIHTSPIRMFLISTTLSPEIVMVNGPPAFMGSSPTIHLPSFATAETSCPWNFTVTFSPSRAVPHTGTGISR